MEVLLGKTSIGKVIREDQKKLADDQMYTIDKDFIIAIGKSYRIKPLKLVKLNPT